jgi:hypothetical protein
MSKSQLDLAALGFTAEEQAWLRGLHWEIQMHLHSAHGRTMIYEAAPLGMAMSTFSPKSKREKPERWFSINGDDKRYGSLADALRVARDRGLIARAMNESTEER